MGLKMKPTSGGGSFEPAPEGTHSAVCTRVIDCGTQDTKFGPKRRLLLGFEIDAEREDGERFMAFANYTQSMHPKATLRRMLESWRGRAYTDEGPEVDLRDLIGKPCLLSLVRSEDGDYTNISGMAPLVKGMTPLEPHGDCIVFDCDAPDLDELEKLSDRMRDKVENSPEFRRAMNGETRPAQPAAPGPDPAMHAPAGDRMPSSEDFNDDIPF